MCFKKTNKTQTSNSSGKMLFYLFIILLLKQNYAAFFLQGSLFVYWNLEKKNPYFLVASTSPFPFLLPANTSVSALLYVDICCLNLEFLFLCLYSSSYFNILEYNCVHFCSKLILIFVICTLNFSQKMVEGKTQNLLSVDLYNYFKICVKQTLTLS